MKRFGLFLLRHMKRFGLFLLRVGTGWLLVVWGLDKWVNVSHGQAVAESYYLGIGTQEFLLRIFGAFEILVGLLVMVGLWRRWLYPVTCLILLTTALAVWKSIIDPFNWFELRGDAGSALFLPSLIVFAGAVVLWGTMSEDNLTVDSVMEKRGDWESR